MIPDVPPRNPTMSRMNGRVPQGIVNDLDMDFEPSCLVRTPSGNVYIPSGNLSEFKRRKNNRIFLAFTVTGESWCCTMYIRVLVTTLMKELKVKRNQKSSKASRSHRCCVCLSHLRLCWRWKFLQFFDTIFRGCCKTPQRSVEEA